MSNDEVPCEAFNLMHILELPIVGHIKPFKEFFVRYINKIYNTNASVPIAGLNDSDSFCPINTQYDITYHYLSLSWHALYYITVS